MRDARTHAREPAARLLYASATAFLGLDDWLQVWPAHGAGSACGKALGAIPQSTVGYERRFSPALAAVAQGEAQFVDFILDGQPEPPLYFARMKRLNRDGVPVLGELPRPRRLAAEELADWLGDPSVVVQAVDFALAEAEHVPVARRAAIRNQS